MREATAARAREAGRAALHRARHRRLAQAPLASRSWTTDEIVERQLGRPPRAFRRVAVRCPFGRPAVTEQAAFDEDGAPVPDAVLRHVPAPRRGDLAARGGRRRRALDAGRGGGRASSRASLADAQAEQRRIRPELAAGIGGATRSGSLKCLHAHAAFALARPGYELGDRILAELPAALARLLLYSRERGRRARTPAVAGREPPGRAGARRPRALPAAADRSTSWSRRAAAARRPDVHARGARRAYDGADDWARELLDGRGPRRAARRRGRHGRRRRLPRLRPRRAPTTARESGSRCSPRRRAVVVFVVGHRARPGARRQPAAGRDADARPDAQPAAARARRARNGDGYGSEPIIAFR